MEMQHVREEIEALLREKELHIKNIERELETLRAAAQIINETTGGGHAQPQAMAAPAPVPTAPVESFPVQSVQTSAPEPARKRWP
jgi:hypothetical protein